MSYNLNFLNAMVNLKRSHASARRSCPYPSFVHLFIYSFKKQTNKTFSWPTCSQLQAQSAPSFSIPRNCCTFLSFLFTLIIPFFTGGTVINEHFPFKCCLCFKLRLTTCDKEYLSRDKGVHCALLQLRCLAVVLVLQIRNNLTVCCCCCCCCVYFAIITRTNSSNKKELHKTCE